MSASNVLETIRLIMIDVFDLDDLEINETTTANDIEEWDSLSHIRLIVAIERKYGFKFQNSEIEALSSIGDLVKFVETKVG